MDAAFNTQPVAPDAVRMVGIRKVSGEHLVRLSKGQEMLNILAANLKWLTLQWLTVQLFVQFVSMVLNEMKKQNGGPCYTFVSPSTQCHGCFTLL